MVHHTQATERPSRKRDRKTAGLPYGPTAVDTMGGQLPILGGTLTPLNDTHPPLKLPRLNMYDTYQPWVLQTYGDQAKTKTITTNKYQRILQYLRGDYIDNENSKFKLWVKGRGFRIGPPPGYYHQSLLDNVLNPVANVASIDYNPDKDPCPDIYVQTGTIKDSEGNDRVSYKKVAVVEDFFEIIYNLHVCRDGKEQKHMGQKRTYRAVSERYAFVPREAVTKFLVLCTECPRRSVGTPVSLANLKNNSADKMANGLPVSRLGRSTATFNPTSPLGQLIIGTPRLTTNLATDSMINGTTIIPSKMKSNFSVVSLVGNGCESAPQSCPPATIHVRKNGTYTFANGLTYTEGKFHPSIKQEYPRTPSPAVKRTSPPKVVKSEPLFGLLTPPDLKCPVPRMPFRLDVNTKEENYSDKISEMSSEIDYSLPITTLYRKHVKSLKQKRNVLYEYNNNLYRDANLLNDSDGGSDEEVKSEKRLDQKSWSPYEQLSPKQSSDLASSVSKNEVPRRSESLSPAVGTMQIAQGESNAEDGCSNGNKDDDDDDQDDENDDDRIDAQYDSERLKAFNMFVRLFVDENLDRIVPISKQPKEKIQAIIDACARQFPEFAERTRKRIRTYLKSCRRNKKARDSTSYETSRPTPPHLTSIQAEQILATACENEAENAKRMRRGLDPISQPNPLTSQSALTQSHVGNSDKQPSSLEPTAASKTDSTGSPTAGKTTERSLVNGTNPTYQPTAFPTFPKSTSAIHSQQAVSMLLSSSIASSSPGSCSIASSQGIANGPTDLSLKGSSTAKSQTRPTLNAIEMTAVRQLITGYRESAAFLLRSADELEILMVQQSP